MRILVTGGRDYDDWEAIYQELARYDHHDPKPTLVHGDCKTGADFLAAQIAHDLGWTLDPHPAKWHIYGDPAGPHRNEEMAHAECDVCIVFPGGKGTADMERRARRVGMALILVGDDETVTQSTLF